MSALRLTSGILLVVAIVTSPQAAAPPARLHLDKWIEDLGSDEAEVWKKAQDSLWAAGDRALPALRAALKNTDADVVLRATVLVSRLEWGIYLDTPAAVVTEIERYRGGDEAQKSAAVTQLTKEGGAGFKALRRLLVKETNDDRKRAIADQLKTLIRPQARDLIARGEFDDAERMLETAAPGSAASALDYCTFLVLTGRAAAKARELEAKSDDKTAAVLGTYLRRAMGDLEAARKLAEKSGDAALLARVLEELEDFKTLAKSPPADLKASPETMAALLSRAGDPDALESAIAQLPQSEHGLMATIYFFNDRPRQAVEAYRKTFDFVGTAALLLTQGRRRDVLAMTVPSEDKFNQGAPLLIEQGVLAYRLGDDEEGKKRIAAAMKAIEATLEKEVKQGSLNDFALGRRINAGKRLNKLDDAIADVGGVLDRLKPAAAPYSVLRELTTPRDVEEKALLWLFLRQHQKDTNPSATLKLLRDWFVTKQADKGFDDVLDAAKKWEGFKDRKAVWLSALARACLAVGKTRQAEGLYVGMAKDSKNPADHQRLGDFYFAQKNWQEAESSYRRATIFDPTLAEATYLRGAATLKIDKPKEGRALIERARLLPLGDQVARYVLAEKLRQSGLAEESDEEQLLLARATPFRSIYASNAASVLGTRAAQKKQYAEAARYMRRMTTNVTFARSGVFTDTRAYLVVPGRAHLFQTHAYLEAGKLDLALAEARKLWEHLPEETAVAADLVRALEKADRKDEAERLFTEAFARLQRSCVDAAKLSDPHNRLAWLAARSRRKLDVALLHAKKATELSPKSAVVFDTLAEVYFQKGDKDEALAAIKKAVKLAPKAPYYAAQQKRIEAGDPKAELPSQ